MLINSRRGQVGVWLFFAFIILGIAIVLLFIFLNGRDPTPPPVQVNVSNTTFFNVSIVFPNIVGSVPVSYVLSNITWDVKGGYTGENCIDVSKLYLQGYILNGSDSSGCPLVGKWIRGKVFVKGLIFSDKLEYYRGGIVANSTVLLEGFSNSYYFNSTICNVSKELYPCKLTLLKKANGYSINLSKTLLTINVSDGSIQKPIICYKYSYCSSNIIMNLTTIPIGNSSDLHWNWDLCYNVSRDLSTITRFPLSIHSNEFFNCSFNVSVLLRDYELSPYKNIGDVVGELNR